MKIKMTEMFGDWKTEIIDSDDMSLNGTMAGSMARELASHPEDICIQCGKYCFEVLNDK